MSFSEVQSKFKFIHRNNIVEVYDCVIYSRPYSNLHIDGNILAQKIAFEVPKLGHQL